MNKIKFTRLWDKLKDPEFTTIRSYTKIRDEYYSAHIGQKFQVWKAEGRYPFRNEYIIWHAWLTDVVNTSPGNILTETLMKEVMIDGVPDSNRLNKIAKMDRVLLLYFSKSPVKSQKTLDNKGKEVKQ